MGFLRPAVHPKGADCRSIGACLCSPTCQQKSSLACARGRRRVCVLAESLNTQPSVRPPVSESCVPDCALCCHTDGRQQQDVWPDHACGARKWQRQEKGRLGRIAGAQGADRTGAREPRRVVRLYLRKRRGAGPLGQPNNHVWVQCVVKSMCARPPLGGAV